MTLRRTLERALAWRRRSKGLRPVSPSRASEARQRIRVREAVFRRDGWRCQMPGWHGACYGSLTYHHLLKASQGGEYGVENGLALCQFHNEAVEMFPAEAEQLGLVRHWWEGTR